MFFRLELADVCLGSSNSGSRESCLAYVYPLSVRTAGGLAGPRQDALATRPTTLLGAYWTGQSSGGAGAGAGAAVSQAYASALSALKNASFQCIPGRP